MDYSEINLTVMKCVLTVIVSFVVTLASNYEYDYDEAVVEASLNARQILY